MPFEWYDIDGCRAPVGSHTNSRNDASAAVDMLRDESPVRFGYVDGPPEKFRFPTGTAEPIGESE